MANDNRDYKEPKPLNPPAPKPISNVTPIRGPARQDNHDSDVDYQPPNPKFVLGEANFTTKLLALVVAVIVFAGLVWLMFHNWMVPGLRHPGAQEPDPGLQQRIP
jgi:hypothetical protein